MKRNYNRHTTTLRIPNQRLGAVALATRKEWSNLQLGRQCKNARRSHRLQKEVRQLLLASGAEEDRSVDQTHRSRTCRKSRVTRQATGIPNVSQLRRYLPPKPA